tara:strand:+ start:323 stop:1264 length:942 start_codon:yes stop_codon:yes gene_type:complete
MKVLFITSTRIGDAVLSTSVLNYILKKYPSSSIFLASGKEPLQIYTNYKNIKKIFILKKKIFKIHWLKLWFKTNFIKWDIIVDLRGSIIAHLLSTKEKYIYKSLDKNIHRFDELASLMQTKYLSLPSIPITTDDLSRAKKKFLKLKNTIAIGASANWPAKVWPAKKFGELIYMLLKHKKFKKNVSIVFFGSSRDIKDTKKIISLIKIKNIKNFCGELNLLEVSACLKQCKIFIGNDSGLMHIAATVGIPTIGLFGPSLETRYGPKGTNAYFVRTKKTYYELTGKKNFNWDTKKNLMNSLSAKSVYKKICKILL